MQLSSPLLSGISLPSGQIVVSVAVDFFMRMRARRNRKSAGEGAKALARSVAQWLGSPIHECDVFVKFVVDPA